MPAKRGGRIASGKTANGSALGYEAQLWAAAEQAVPASHYGITEYNRARPEGLFGFTDPKSEWFIKDEPQRAEAAENYSLSASNGIPRSRERERMSAGQ